jgi:hypothetical protein
MNTTHKNQHLKNEKDEEKKNILMTNNGYLEN